MIRGRLTVSLAVAFVPVLLQCGSASQGQSRTSRPVKIARPTLPSGPQFYVAPNGNPRGDGSKEHPWDLATALSGPVLVQPRSTIWLRGGTYGSGATIFVSRLVGRPEAPIIVRQYEGE